MGDANHRARWTELHSIGGAEIEDADEAELVQPPGTSGDRKAYKYFGAAKNLPGVKELFRSSRQEGGATHETPNESTHR